MEDLTNKLNKYIIKLNNLLDNEEINSYNYDRYLLYLKKVDYYYNLVGAGGGDDDEKKRKKAEADAAKKAEAERKKTEKAAADAAKKTEKAAADAAKKKASAEKEKQEADERAEKALTHKWLGLRRRSSDEEKLARERAKVKQDSKLESAPLMAKQREENKLNKKKYGRLGSWLRKTQLGINESRTSSSGDSGSKFADLVTNLGNARNSSGNLGSSELEESGNTPFRKLGDLGDLGALGDLGDSGNLNSMIKEGKIKLVCSIVPTNNSEA